MYLEPLIPMICDWWRISWKRNVFIKAIIFLKTNDQGDYQYVVVEGLVGISIHAGKDEYVVTRKSGESFGEMNLIDDLTRSATAVVLEDTFVLKLDKQKLRGLILSYPELGLGMLVTLSLNLRETTKKAYQLR
jgi:CRP/FNR family cyclic AMP-dependent transcriptional regulator